MTDYNPLTELEAKINQPMRRVVPVQLPTDAGGIVEGWQVVGCDAAYPGADGEAKAIKHARRLDEGDRNSAT